jgi:hypothetical protein
VTEPDDELIHLLRDVGKSVQNDKRLLIALRGAVSRDLKWLLGKRGDGRLDIQQLNQLHLVMVNLGHARDESGEYIRELGRLNRRMSDREKNSEG